MDDIDWKHCSSIRRKPSVSAGVSMKIESGPVVRIRYEPGTGTRYEVMFVNLKGMRVEGTSTQDESKDDRGQRYWLMCLINGSEKCYPVFEDVDWSYVATKFAVNEVTAKALTELIRFVLGGEDRVGAPEYEDL